MSGYFRLNSQKALDKLLQQRGVVLVDFEAEWCPPCKNIKPYLLKRCQETESDLAMVNVDQGEELVDTFGVTEIPCLMVFEKNSTGLKYRSLGMTSGHVESALQAYSAAKAQLAN